MPVPVNSGEEARRIATQRAARRRKKLKPPVSVRPQTKTPVAPPPSRTPRPVAPQTDASAPGGAAGYRTTRPERKVRNREIRRARARVERRRARAQERAYRSQGEAVTRQAQRLAGQTHEARVRRALGPRVDPLKVLTDAFSRVYIPSTGGGPSGVRLATGRSRTAAVLAPKVQYGQSETARNIGRDAVLLGTSPFVGGYEVGAAAVEAARGDTSRAERLGKGVVEGVKQSVPGRLVAGDLEGAAEEFGEHPLLAALDVGAVSSIAGRTAGAVARGAGSKPGAGGVRGGLARGGSTVRPPLALSDDAAPGGLVERTYSKDLTRKAAQVAADRRREPLRDADGKVVTVAQRGREVPVLKATGRERARHEKRAADFAASRASNVERMVRDEAVRELRVRGVRGRNAQALVSMVVEGTITSAKHFEADLRAHRDRLAAVIRDHESGESPFRHGGELDAARARLAVVERALRSEKVNKQAPKIVRVGEDIGRRLNEREREAVGLGMLNERAARRSKLVPAAIEHLGARYHREEELRALERSGVDVREPKALKAHGDARAAVTAAKQQEKTLQGRLARVRRERSETVGAQRVRRGQEKAPQRVYVVDGKRFERREDAAAAVKAARAKGRRPKIETRALTGREAARTGEAARLARVEASLRRELTAARRKRRDAERGLGKAPLPPIREALRGPDGRFLSNDQVEALLREKGRDPETVAYLPHRADVRGTRAFHTQFRPGSRPQLDSGPSRTGEAYRRGATEASVDLIRDHGVRQRTQIAKARQIDRAVSDRGRKRPDGRYWTANEALEAAQRLEQDTGERFVPVRAFAARLSPDVQKVIRDDHQSPLGMESLGLRLLNDRVIRSGDRGRARNVILMPATYVERLERHLQPAGGLLRFGQLLNRPFRLAVLPQPRWLTGNFVEPFLVRLPVAGSGLVNLPGFALDLAAATKVLRKMERDPKMRAAAKEIRAQQLGGLFIGGRGASVRRTGEEVGGAAAWATVVRGLPVVKQLGDMAVMPLNAFFRGNRVIEAVAQRAALGKSIRRDVQEFEGSWLKAQRLSKRAVDQAARGLTNTATQRRFMRAQHELLGKYEGFPPLLREAVQSYTPFLPWALNAARFVYWTMPVHHTATTAALIKSSQVVEETWKAQHADAPPGGLRYAPRTADGGFVDVARYTPYGLSIPISEGDVQPATDQFMPQLSGAWEALGGRDPFGRPLQIDPRENAGETEPNLSQRVGIGANSLLEAVVPYLSTGRRLREGGGTGFAGSTILDPDVKPGTQRMGAARRTFDPFRPTYLGGAAGAPSRPSRPRRRTPADDDLDAAIDAALSDLGAEAEGQDAAISEALDQVAADAEFAAAEDAAIDEALRELVP